MTTTTHPKLSMVTALRDKARSTEHPPEAESLMAKAKQLCEKYGIDAAILDEETKTIQNREINLGGGLKYTAPERRYPCRFGCGPFIQHTAEELSACADKARARSATGNAYEEATKAENERREREKQQWKTAGFTNGETGGFYYGEAGFYSDPSSGWGGTKTTGGKAGKGTRVKDGTRKQSQSHANCYHEATKAARARCRREGGPWA